MHWFGWDDASIADRAPLLVYNAEGRNPMNAVTKMKRTAEASPLFKARTLGVVYLLYFLTAVSADLFVGTSRMTAYKAVNLVAEVFYIAVIIGFYVTFKPVNRWLSLVAACFGLLGCANDVLRLLKVAPYRINSLLFFGFYCLLIGYLIYKSTFLPRILGVLMMLAGLGWLVFLSPLAMPIAAYIKVLGFLAEASLMLWLIVKGRKHAAVVRC
jgi:Domain of unknown function (DUF4386)